MKPRFSLLLAGALLLPGASVSAADEPALPAPEEVVRRVLDNLEREIANEKVFQQNYRHTRSRVREFRSAEGAVRKTESRLRTNDPLAVVAPQPRPEPKLPRSRTKITETGTNARGRFFFEKLDLSIGENLLQRFEFEVAGRELVNGRPAILVDFQPARKRPPERGIKDRFINRTAGRVWVDEADAAPVKAGVFLTEPVGFFGGLIGVVQVFTFNFLRERTPGGIWFTRDSQWHIEGREVFIPRIVSNREEIFDVQRAR